MANRLPCPDIHISTLRQKGQPYPVALQRIVGHGLAGEAVERITEWDGYRPTPVLDFAGLAERCGVQEILCKYEGDRFEIGSFKALGGAYALQRALEAHEGPLNDLVAVTASDGNHGLSLAWGAKQAGVRCIVFLHAGVSQNRQELIEAQGAEVVRVDGNYDLSTATADKMARENGWLLVPDTANNENPNPINVMAGYGVMLEEMFGAKPQCDMPTHVFIQGGCGGLAAAVVGWLRERDNSTDAPKFIIVEPVEAACLIASARAGSPVLIGGDLDTIMSGLSVGEVSGVAWPVIAFGTDAYMSIPDTMAIWTMQGVREGAFGDAPVEIGDSGIAGLAGLVAVSRDEERRARIGLTSQSRVLVIATEGPVDRISYDALCSRDLSDAGLPDFADFGAVSV
ncbi:diaminopropionate ammonia-lyase [Celeribacter persicus]|uniref:Diaminopropionate ammonia-lyase n=1 Tax=Celeribacter persicus TaxID=1651082 RepID=A0A2T5HUQ9_9RHOB|nr:diaminopropionate ammonia-lyase [Celeribacter persicus]PTQ75306.1 diaminopropionate ammonia-lyase [Celeribacter persicus]